jgi:hypothetical protein
MVFRWSPKKYFYSQFQELFIINFKKNPSMVGFEPTHRNMSLDLWVLTSYRFNRLATLEDSLEKRRNTRLLSLQMYLFDI